MRAARPILPAPVIAVDGKTIRRSHDRGQGTAAMHLVRAWAAAQRLVLAQATVEDRTTAITAIPAVLAALTVAGCLVTLDARGWQRVIAQQLRDQGGDYGLALKDNQPQPALAADIQECFAQVQASAFADLHHDGHGLVAIVVEVGWRSGGGG